MASLSSGPTTSTDSLGAAAVVSPPPQFPALPGHADVVAFIEDVARAAAYNAAASACAQPRHHRHSGGSTASHTETDINVNVIMTPNGAGAAAAAARDPFDVSAGRVSGDIAVVTPRQHPFVGAVEETLNSVNESLWSSVVRIGWKLLPIVLCVLILSLLGAKAYAD